MSLYASREGALYQSYDNYAGQQGFYEPEQQGGGMPQPPAGLATTGMEQYAQYYPQESPQRQVFQEFQNYYQQPEMMMQQHVGHQTQMVARTVMMPIVRQQPVVTQQIQAYQPQPMMMQFQPVQYNQELRGVGIKFGEKIDPQTGGMTVYVKRLVRGGPADQSQQISPGDTLLLINSEDVYGLSLNVLRNKIPGAAGTSVRLGFKSVQGRMYEVNLRREAYGDPSAPQQQQQMPPPQQYVPPQPPQQYMPPQQQTIMIPNQQPQFVMQPPQQQFMMQPPQQQFIVQQPPQQQFVMQPPQPQFVMQQPQQQFVMQQPPQQTVQYVTVQQPQPPQQQFVMQQAPPQPQVQYVQQQPQYQAAPVQQYEQPQYQQPQQQQYAPPSPQQQYQQYQPEQQQYQQPQQQYNNNDWYGQESGVQGTQV